NQAVRQKKANSCFTGIERVAGSFEGLTQQIGSSYHERDESHPPLGLSKQSVVFRGLNSVSFSGEMSFHTVYDSTNSYGLFHDLHQVFPVLSVLLGVRAVEAGVGHDVF